MHGHSGRGHKWRRFRRKYATRVFVGLFLVVAMVASVGLLMYMLTSMSCRPRY
jgi:hypothetical protein